MLLTRARAAVAAPLAALVAGAVAIAGCASSATPDAGSAPDAVVDGAPAPYVAASADSCRRAQLRAEAEPEFRVRRDARPLRTNAQPRFPLSVPKRRYQQVTVRFLVDTAGRVDMSTAEIVTTSGKAFTEEVMLVLPEWRFEPAELVPGCRVPFRFTNNIVFNKLDA